MIDAARPARVGLHAAIGLGLASGLLVILQALLLARIVDSVVFRHHPLRAVMPALVGLFALFVLRAALTFLSEIAAHRAAAAVKTELRQALLNHIFTLGPAHAAGERSADLAATLTDGIDALEPFLARYLPQKTLVALVPLAILATLFPIDWVSGLVLAVSGPLIPLFMVFVGQQAEVINQRQWRQLLAMSAHLLDAVQGITTLKLFGRAREEIALIARISDEYRRTTMASLRIAFLTSAVLEFFASLAIALVAVIFGARLLHGRADFFAAFLVLLLVPEFFLPLRTLATHYHARMSALAAARRIFAVLDVEPAARPGTATPPPGPVTISCRALEAGYEPDRPILRGIDCDFPAGRSSAIVGRSGAGKSSLAAAILGFIAPSAGMILVNGVPLATFDRETWWRRLAYVPQAPRIFAGTIADNLRLARPDADETALRSACRSALLLDVIESLPQGFATRLGEGGTGLSGGEIQRLALARAFLKDAPLLILDEATAHLDLETEAMVAQAIADLVRNRTSILIAHRLATVRRADQILVMEAGRVAECGTHESLLAHGGAYAALLKTVAMPT
ncbi:MAG TPA: thiol reductant ABC exporter subunit CydD [Acetobacteraceae bacterium]|nr:thiol reductant ABC exporter subunit CydD [Acetobacteraceae bacterium]